MTISYGGYLFLNNTTLVREEVIKMQYRNNYYKNDAEPDLPSLRTCLILVAFIALVGDFSWMSENRPSEVLPCTPEWDACMENYQTTLKSFQSAIKAGKISLEEGAEYDMKIWSLRSTLRIGQDRVMREVVQETRRVFVNGWQPDAKTPDWVKEEIKTEEDRQGYAGMYFDSVWVELRETARLKYENLKPPTSAQLWAAVRIVAIWMVKWYFLMTCPAFLIVLLNKRQAGSSIKEELVLQPQRWLLACLSGPIGLACISETGAKVTRFRQFRDEYFAQHPDVNYIGPAAEAAIWRKVEQPLLSFDEAITLVKSGMTVRKPAFACLIVWLLGLFSVHALVVRVVQVQELVVCCQQDEADGVKTENGNFRWLAAIMPQLPELPELEIVVSIVGAKWTEVKSEIRLAAGPRGPPSAVKEQPQEIVSLSLGCTMQKRG